MAQQLNVRQVSQELSQQSHNLQRVVNQQVNDDWRINYLRFRDLLEELIDSSKTVVNALPQGTLDMIGDLLEEDPSEEHNVIEVSVCMQIIETAIAQTVHV